MFDLEQAIAEWRKQMLAAGIKSPAPLEELETHLREEIEQQTKSGLNPPQAFEVAVRKIGHARTLRKEFNKVERTFMTKIAIVGLGIFAVLFGPAMILPALAKHRDSGIWNYDIAWPIIVGAIITLTGIGIAIFGFRKRRT